MVPNIRGHAGDLRDHCFGGVTEMEARMRGPEE